MNLLKTFGMLSGLSGTYRFSNAKLVHRESVLEHLGGVTLTCFLILNELDATDQSIAHHVLSKAIVHDVEELLMGDIPRTTKYASPESLETFKDMELEAIRKITSELELSNSQLEAFHTFAKVNVSGLIVKIADALAVVYKVHEEAIERGNTAMMGRATTIKAQLEACEDEISKTNLSENSQDFLANLIWQASEIIDKAKATVTLTTIREKSACEKSQSDTPTRPRTKLG